MSRFDRPSATESRRFPARGGQRRAGFSRSSSQRLEDPASARCDVAHLVLLGGRRALVASRLARARSPAEPRRTSSCAQANSVRAWWHDGADRRLQPGGFVEVTHRAVNIAGCFGEHAQEVGRDPHTPDVETRYRVA